MAIELIAKIKQANNGTFKLLDAIDVELKDGSDLQSFIDNIDDKINIPLPDSGKCNSVVSSDEEPTDEEVLIWIDTSENENIYGDTLQDKIIEEFRAMFKYLNNTISELQRKNVELEARIAFLEENGSGGNVTPPPIIPDGTSNSEILIMEDGSMLVDEFGNILAFNIVSNSDTSSSEVLTTEDGSILIDELGNILAFNVTSNVDSTNDTVLITEKNEILITEKNEILKF